MTTYKVGDLVKVDERAAFRNDVQLDHFDNPHLNLGLINSYLFSSALPGGRQFAQSQSISPAGVLENLVQSFVSSRLDNRFYLIATYGHGKSHLALALANYFSRPCHSPEVVALLEKLSNALGDPARSSRYAEFKESRGEFLVLRLRGDVPYDLHEQVLKGLENALSEHTATRNQKLPFWFTEAEKIIAGFRADEKEKANQFLESNEHDLALLKQRLNDREDVYDLCVKLIHHVKGVRPNLGGEVSLANVVRWATDNFCGHGKPLGGLLILFDEFSLYVQRYARRSAVGELQDLLNGVSDRQGKAAFLAFSQLDLMQLADNLHITGDTRASLKHELTRIPKKWVLFSLMESVVDAYLVQNEDRWRSLLGDKMISGAFYQATDISWERFNKRYANTLRWTFEEFQERVAKGSFPLHPITTYLLCNLRLQSDDAGVPRTVLGFVLEELRARESEPAIDGKRPNWILPISLVSYFEGRLSGDIYDQYVTARRTIGDDAPPEQHAILKALLLQFLAEVNARHQDQISFLAHAAGIEEKTVRHALRTLVENGVIRYDRSYRVNSFWPVSNQPKVLEETVQKKLTQFQWTMDALDDLNKALRELLANNFGSIDVKVDWGHQTDWRAREYVITSDLLTLEWLKGLTARYGYNHRELIEADRSTVIWVVANQDDEVENIRGKVNGVMQEAFAAYSQNPPVVVFVVPLKARPEMVEAYRRRWALLKFSQQERADAGQEMYDAETKQAELSLLRALKEVRKDDQNMPEMPRSRVEYLVPTAYVTAIRTREEVSLRDLLTTLYLTAYAYAPNEFFTQYRVASRGANKLRDATRIVAEPLMRNAAADLKALTRGQAVVRDLCDKFLVRNWEILTAAYRINEEPGSRRIREAWQHIDAIVKPGNVETKLRDALFPLLNPPYGYDYNTALLLFSAWFGYHRLDLEVSVSGFRTSQQALIDLTGKGAKDFFQAIAVSDVVSLRRRVAPDKVEIKARIQEAGNKQFDLETANNEVVWLQEMAVDERFDVDMRQSAEQVAENLTQAMALAREYEQDVNGIKEHIGRSTTAKELMALQKKIAVLPHLGNVQTKAETPTSLRQQIEQRFTSVIEAVCQENETPQKLTEVGLNRQRLQEEKRAIARAGLPLLTQRIDESLQRLAQREVELQNALREQQRVENLRATIKSVDQNGSLQHLRVGVTVLQGLAGLPENLSKQRDVRLQIVEKTISEIQQQIARSRTELETIDDLVRLKPIRDALLKLQHRCIETPEADEIHQLLEIAETIQARLIAKAQYHAQLEQTILNAGEHALLHKLIADIAQLEEMVNLSPRLTHLRNNRVKALQEAVAAIRADIWQAQQSLEAAEKMVHLNKVRDTLYTLKARCAETPEAEEIENLLLNLRGRQEQLAQAERQAADVRWVIQAADPKTTLKRLLQARQQLVDLADVPPDLSRAREQRLGEIEQAVDAIRSQIEQTRVNLETTRERRAIDKMRDALLQLQTRCTDMPEEGETAQLIARADQLKIELEEEARRIHEWRTTINAINSKSTRLRYLLNSQATLQSLSVLPEVLIGERDMRLKEVEKAIAVLEQQANQIGPALSSVAKPEDLRKQRDKLLNLKQRCEDTPLHDIILRHLETADALQSFFARLESERNRTIHSLADSQRHLKRLEQLGKDYQLSDVQRALIDNQQEQIKKSARDQRAKAFSWLAEQEKHYENNPVLPELEKRLENPPETFNFLSLSEQRQLVGLRQRVAQSIDADSLMAIETRFRQIRDRRLQAQCLQTLQRILDGQA